MLNYQYPYTQQELKEIKLKAQIENNEVISNLIFHIEHPLGKEDSDAELEDYKMQVCDLEDRIKSAQKYINDLPDYTVWTETLS